MVAGVVAGAHSGAGLHSQPTPRPVVEQVQVTALEAFFLSTTLLIRSIGCGEAHEIKLSKRAPAIINLAAPRAAGVAPASAMILLM